MRKLSYREVQEHAQVGKTTVSKLRARAWIQMWLRTEFTTEDRVVGCLPFPGLHVSASITFQLEVSFLCVWGEADEGRGIGSFGDWSNFMFGLEMQLTLSCSLPEDQCERSVLDPVSVPGSLVPAFRNWHSFVVASSIHSKLSSG